MTRSIRTIARDISDDWTKPNFAAVPYLDAMQVLEDLNDKFYSDSAEYIVRYFLANATAWRGDTARAIKAELKAMLGGK